MLKDKGFGVMMRMLVICKNGQKLRYDDIFYKIARQVTVKLCCTPEKL